MKTSTVLMFWLLSSSAYSQYPAPTNFQFNYEYIMMGDWGDCDGVAVSGPTYCSHFYWLPPDTTLTTATLEYYVIYNDTAPIVSVTDTFYHIEQGFIGELYVTAVYLNPNGESDSSNIVVNPGLPISVEEKIKSQATIKIKYNISTQQLIVDNKKNIKLIKVYNILGDEIISKSRISETIELKELKPGIYFIVIIERNDTVNKRKIIVL